MCPRTTAEDRGSRGASDFRSEDLAFGRCRICVDTFKSRKIHSCRIGRTFHAIQRPQQHHPGNALKMNVGRSLHGQDVAGINQAQHGQCRSCTGFGLFDQFC